MNRRAGSLALWGPVALACALLVTPAAAEDTPAAQAGQTFQIDLDRAALRQRVPSLLELPVGKTTWVAAAVLGGYDGGSTNWRYPAGILCVDQGTLKIFGGQEYPDGLALVKELNYIGDQYLALRLDEYSVRLAASSWTYAGVQQLADTMAYPCESTPFAPDTLLEVAGLAIIDKSDYAFVSQSFASLSELMDYVAAEQEGE